MEQLNKIQRSRIIFQKLSLSESQIHTLGSLIFSGYHMLKPFKLGDPKPFVIITSGRSGSSLLVDLLDKHPKIRSQSELLNTKVPYPLLFIKGLSSYYRDQDITWGFKLKINQLINRQKIINAEDFLFNLSISNFRFIYLKRNNILKQALSAIIGYQTGNYHNLNPNSSISKISVKTDILLSTIDNIESCRERDEKIISQIPHIKICYEKDIIDETQQQITANKLFDYLGLYSVDTYTVFNKVSKKNLQEYIENYDEIVSKLSSPRYKKYLQDLTSV